MLDLRTYGIKIHFNTTNTGHIGWHGRDEILYKGVSFTISKFRGMIHGLLHRARELLRDDLLLGLEGVPKVP